MRYKFHSDNLDADTNAFINSALEYIDRRVWATDYPERKARQLIPPNRSVPAGAESYTWWLMNRTGVAKIINGANAGDIPMVNAFGTKQTSKIFTIALGYYYTLMEMKAAAAASQIGRQPPGATLDQTRAMACREGYEDLIDEIASIGNAEFGIVGMLNQPNVPAYTIPVGAAGQTGWDKKTPDEIIADASGIRNYIFKLTKQVENPTRLVLPTDAYSHIADTPRSVNSDTTILEFLLANKTFADIVPWSRLDGAGVGGKDRMMAYTPDPVRLELVLPMEQENQPPQYQDLLIKVPTLGQCGGVVFHKPYSAAYADGIGNGN